MFALGKAEAVSTKVPYLGGMSNHPVADGMQRGECAKRHNRRGLGDGLPPGGATTDEDQIENSVDGTGASLGTATSTRGTGTLYLVSLLKKRFDVDLTEYSLT